MDNAVRGWNTHPMLETSDLHIFARIVDAGSLSAAARSLAMPKSSVSRALGRLEAEAGTALLDRTPRTLRLTDAGRLLLRHTRRILDDVGEAEAALGGLIGVPSGLLTVSATATFAAGPLAAMLPGLLDAWPDLRIRLVLATAPVDLLAEDVDVSIRMGPLPDSALIARRIATVPRWFCASPAYLRGRPPVTAPADLNDHRVLHGHEGIGRLRLGGTDGTTEEIAVAPAVVAVEPIVLLNLTLAGAGIAPLPSVYVRTGIANGTLVRVLPDRDLGSVAIHALYPSHRSLSAKTRVFLDALVAHFAEGGPDAFRVP